MESGLVQEPLDGETWTEFAGRNHPDDIRRLKSAWDELLVVGHRLAASAEGGNADAQVMMEIVGEIVEMLPPSGTKADELTPRNAWNALAIWIYSVHENNAWGVAGGLWNLRQGQGIEDLDEP